MNNSPTLDCNNSDKLLHNVEEKLAILRRPNMQTVILYVQPFYKRIRKIQALMIFLISTYVRRRIVLICKNVINRLRTWGDYLTVHVKQGGLRGKAELDCNGNKFYSFKGVPYAEPPIGKLRFKAPRPKTPWNGIRDAFEYGNPCRSRDFFSMYKFRGSEDCLYLNVYTPEFKKADKLRPVMVFIHGGAFTTGSGSGDLYGPNYLVAEDVVLVTLNYRLGAFGFLAFYNPEIECPGNFGIKDVLAALKWINENIEEFYGDPNNVTIFGESAGAAIVHYLTLAPAAKGYFHKIICQSGCANVDWACDKARPHELAKQMGFESNNDRDVYEFLMGASTDEIAEAQEHLITEADVREGVTGVWCPTIEVRCKNEPNLITEHPFITLYNGTFTDVPMIIGYNKDEGLMFLSTIRKPKLYLVPDFVNNEVLVPRALHLKRGFDISKEAGDILRRFYYGESIPSMQNVEPFIKIMTDIGFTIAINYAIKAHVKYSKNPIYAYRFCIDSTQSMVKSFLDINYPGTTHADDLAYLFSNILSPVYLNRDDDIRYKAVYRMVKMWTQFAKTGNPNVDNDPLINVTWEPVTWDKMYFLNIDTDLTLGPNKDIKRIQLWESLVERYMNFLIDYVKKANRVNERK